MDEHALQAAEALLTALASLNSYEPLATQYPDSAYDHTSRALNAVLAHHYGPEVAQRIREAAFDSGTSIAQAIDWIVVQQKQSRRQSLDRAQLLAKQAADGDSNDTEIEYLQDALDEALALIGGDWSEPDEED